jgi:hypothetical protein
VKSQLEFISQVRKDLNRDGLLFNDICQRIFDYLVDSYSSREELLEIMSDAKSLEAALDGSRLQPTVSAAPPLERAYIVSVFKEIALRSTERSPLADKRVPGNEKTAFPLKQLGY